VKLVKPSLLSPGQYILKETLRVNGPLTVEGLEEAVLDAIRRGKCEVDCWGEKQGVLIIGDVKEET
jgi:hypothetical protein